MATDEDPIVGQWYQRLDKDVQFKVTSVDEGAGLVEIEYLDGEVEEFDADDWYGLDLELIEAPEEASSEEEEELEEDEEEEEEEWDEDEDEESLDDWEEEDEDDWGKDY